MEETKILLGITLIIGITISISYIMTFNMKDEINRLNDRIDWSNDLICLRMEKVNEQSEVVKELKAKVEQLEKELTNKNKKLMIKKVEELAKELDGMDCNSCIPANLIEKAIEQNLFIVYKKRDTIGVLVDGVIDANIFDESFPLNKSKFKVVNDAGTHYRIETDNLHATFRVLEGKGTDSERIYSIGIVCY